MENTIETISDFIRYLDMAELNIFTTAIRLLMAMIFGATLGFERTRKLRAAGFKTYSLVCVGSAAAMMVGMFTYQNYNTSDPTRMAAQVISGIGFLGAGTIMVTGYHCIKGLTTAAGLWVNACMGLVIGIGYYEAAVIMLIIIMIIMVLGEKLQNKYLASSKRLRLYVLLDKDDGFYKFISFLKEHSVEILEFEIMETIGNYTSISFVLKSPTKEKHSVILDTIKSSNFVAYVDET